MRRSRDSSRRFSLLAVLQALFVTPEILGEELRIVWSRVHAHPGQSAGIECVAGSESGSVAVLFSRSRGHTEGAAFSLLRVDAAGVAAGAGLVEAADAPALLGTYGGCADAGGSRLLVAGARAPGGSLAFFIVDDAGGLSVAADVRPRIEARSVRRVLTLGRGRFVAVGGSASGRPLAAAFGEDGTLAWRLRPADGARVEIVDALEDPEAGFLLVGLERDASETAPADAGDSRAGSEAILWLGRLDGEGKLQAERRLAGLEGRWIVGRRRPTLVVDRREGGDWRLLLAELESDLTPVREETLLSHFGRLATLEAASDRSGRWLVARYGGELTPELRLFDSVGSPLARLSDRRIGAGPVRLVATAGAYVAVSQEYEFSGNGTAKTVRFATRVTRLEVR